MSFFGFVCTSNTATYHTESIPVANSHCVSCLLSVCQYRFTFSHSTRYCTFPSGVTRLAKILTASPPPQLLDTVPSAPPTTTPPAPPPPTPPSPPLSAWYGVISRRMRGSSCFCPGCCWWLCWWFCWWWLCRWLCWWLC